MRGEASKRGVRFQCASTHQGVAQPGTQMRQERFPDEFDAVDLTAAGLDHPGGQQGAQGRRTTGSQPAEQQPHRFLREMGRTKKQAPDRRQHRNPRHPAYYHSIDSQGPVHRQLGRRYRPDRRLKDARLGRLRHQFVEFAQRRVALGRDEAAQDVGNLAPALEFLEGIPLQGRHDEITTTRQVFERQSFAREAGHPHLGAQLQHRLVQQRTEFEHAWF